MVFHIRPATAHFIDRQDELRRAVAAVAEWREGSRPLTIPVTGVGGVGKTELVFMIARGIRERHAPQDVLYVDLDTLRQDGVVEVGDVLGKLLRDLKVEPEWLERSFSDRQEHYWQRTDRRRLVLIVDNARTGAELVPLLPSSGESVVIVASQAPLHDLAADASLSLALSPLTDRDAAELLRRLAADPRLDAEPEAVEGFVRACAGLPAALHVAAKRISRHKRRPLSRLLAALKTDLEEEGVPTVEKVWDAAHGELGPDAALLYRLLADAPPGGLPPEAVVALLGRGQDAADAALEELEDVGLLDGRERRVRLHALLGAHARRKTRRDGDEAERADGLSRLLRWYLRQARHADLAAAGPRLTEPIEVEAVPGTTDMSFGDTPEADEVERARRAYRWLAEESHALYACVRLAHAMGLDAEACALCEPLWTHYLDDPQHGAALEAFGSGVAAAQRLGDVRRLVRMRCQRARPLWELERFAEAGEELRLAASAASSLGDSTHERKLGASVVEFRGMLAGARGDWSAAVGDFERALGVHQEIDNAYGAMLMNYRLGEALARLDDLSRAVRRLTLAHEAARELKRLRMSARTGYALGGVRRRLGHHAQAAQLFATALAGARERRSSHDEARVLGALAELAEETGDAAAAREHRAAASALRERHGGVG